LLQIDARFLDIGQALSMAQALLNGYKVPVPRLRAITVDGDADTDNTLWTQVLSREISDRIHVQLNLPGQIGLDSDMFVGSDPAHNQQGDRSQSDVATELHQHGWQPVHPRYLNTRHRASLARREGNAT